MHTQQSVQTNCHNRIFIHVFPTQSERNCGKIQKLYSKHAFIACTTTRKHKALDEGRNARQFITLTIMGERRKKVDKILPATGAIVPAADIGT